MVAQYNLFCIRNDKDLGEVGIFFGWKMDK